MGHLSREEALALPDEDLEDGVFHHALHRLAASAPEARSTEERLAALPEGLRPVYASFAVSLQVHNGGFNQLFWNVPSATVAEQAAEAYEAFGAVEVARIVRAALDTWRGEAGRHERYKEAVREAGSWQPFADSYEGTGLTEFDDPFYAAEEAEGLTARRAAWVRANPEACELDRLEDCFPSEAWQRCALWTRRQNG